MDDIAEKINARKKSLEVRMPGVLIQIEKALAPRLPVFSTKLEQVLVGTNSRRSKVNKIQELISEVSAVAGEYIACKKGCSACCTQRVTVSQTEADAIAYKIGTTAVQLRPGYVLPDIHNFGVDTPCTFLVEHSCSIYEYRPFACRNQVNLDIDPLLCGFENWELEKAKDQRSTPIPMLGLGPLQEAYKKVSGQDLVGDIRVFFPK